MKKKGTCIVEGKYCPFLKYSAEHPGLRQGDRPGASGPTTWFHCGRTSKAIRHIRTCELQGNADAQQKAFITDRAKQALDDAERAYIKRGVLHYSPPVKDKKYQVTMSGRQVGKTAKRKQRETRATEECATCGGGHGTCPACGRAIRNINIPRGTKALAGTMSISMEDGTMRVSGVIPLSDAHEVIDPQGVDMESFQRTGATKGNDPAGNEQQGTSDSTDEPGGTGD